VQVYETFQIDMAFRGKLSIPNTPQKFRIVRCYEASLKRQGLILPEVFGKNTGIIWSRSWNC